MPVFYALHKAVEGTDSPYMVAALFVILIVMVVGIVWMAVRLWKDK